MYNRFAFENLPTEGPLANKAWDIASRGFTLGIFQLDSSLGQKYCKLVKPKSVAEIAYITSIIRPGCLDAGVSESFVKRRNGLEKIEPIHPKLSGILDPTQGYWLFQEDMVRAVCYLTGWNQVEGDLLRIACAKKLPEEMAKLKLKFIESCIEHSKISDKESNDIFDIIEKSQRYLFNLNHATLYSAMSYVDLFLKANYSAIFYCANLILAHQGAEKWDTIRDLVVDARKLGLKFLPPSLEHLDETFSIIKQPDDSFSIRVGFSNLKGLGKSHLKVVKKLVGLPNWKSFILRVLKSKKATDDDTVSRTAVEVLVKSGCLDYYCLSRDRMLHEYNILRELTSVELRYVEQRLKENSSNTFDLKEIIDGMLVDAIPIRGRPDKIRALVKDYDIVSLLPSSRNAFMEADTIGTSVTCRYIDEYSLDDCTHECSTLHEAAEGDIVTVAGRWESQSIHRDRKNQEYARGTLCDGYGSTPCLIFSNTFKEYQSSTLLEDGAMIKMTGKTSDGSILINRIEALI